MAATIFGQFISSLSGADVVGLILGFAVLGLVMLFLLALASIVKS